MKNVLFVRSSLLVAALLASTSLAPAQVGSANGKAPAAAPQGQKEPAKPAAENKPAATAQQRGVALSLPVTGLTKDNADKVKTNLEALNREFYACAACHQESAKPGKCPGCKADMAAKKEPVLKDIKVMADTSKIDLTANPGAEVRLSALERALTAASVKVDDAKLPIAGHAQLIFRDGASADEATAVQKALEGAKLFQSVKARFDATAKETVVEVNGGSSGATRTAVASALEKAGSKSRPNDIVWSAPAAGSGGSAGAQ